MIDAADAAFKKAVYKFAIDKLPPHLQALSRLIFNDGFAAGRAAEREVWLAANRKFLQRDVADAIESRVLAAPPAANPERDEHNRAADAAFEKWWKEQERPEALRRANECGARESYLMAEGMMKGSARAAWRAAQREWISVKELPPSGTPVITLSVGGSAISDHVGPGLFAEIECGRVVGWIPMPALPAPPAAERKGP